MEVALDPANPFKDVIPFATMRILQLSVGAEGEALPQQIIMRWWEINEKTSFFRHKATSKMVRRAVRQATVFGDSAAHIISRTRWRH